MMPFLEKNLFLKNPEVGIPRISCCGEKQSLLVQAIKFIFLKSGSGVKRLMSAETFQGRGKVLAAILLVFVFSLILFFVGDRAFAHEGHSHGPSQSSTSLSGLELARQDKPFVLALALQAGYRNDPYTGVMPGLSFFWGDESLSLLPSYHLRFRQFLAQEQVENPNAANRVRDQEIDHQGKLELKKKIAGSFSLGLLGKFQLTGSRIESSSINDVQSFTINPTVGFRRHENLSFEAGYEVAVQQYPRGTISIPPLAGTTGSGDTIFPQDPFQSPSAANEIIEGISDTQQSGYFAATSKLGVASLTCELRMVVNRSTDFDRDYDGYRLTAGVERKLWQGGTGKIEHQLEGRSFSEKSDLINMTELNVSHRLSEGLKISALNRLNIVQSLGTTTWEGYLELASGF